MASSSDCLNRLNGMFAFAICDLRGSSPKLFLARDHFGIKPLYYSRTRWKTRFCFRDQGAARSAGNRSAHEYGGAHQYLTFLWVPDPRRCSRESASSRPATMRIWQRGEFKIEQYWDLTFPPAGHRFEQNEAELADEIRERFCASVEQQMVSDVPIGAFLSAGLDSSSIVAAMARKAASAHLHDYLSRKISRRRIHNRRSRRSASPRTTIWAASITRSWSSPMWSICCQILPGTWMSRPPIRRSSPRIWCAAKRENRRPCLLSGVGGDEIFAGYRKHVAHGWAEEYRRVPGFARSAAERTLLGLPSLRGTRMKGSVRLAKKMARSAAL